MSVKLEDNLLHVVKNFEFLNFKKISKSEKLNRQHFLTLRLNHFIFPQIWKSLRVVGVHILKKFIISKENKNFSILNQKMVVGKSDPNLDIFDSIIVASRDIKQAFIPSYIKKIDSSTFSHCCRLKSIQFDKNSKLEKIDDKVFSDSSIEKISIPSSVGQIGRGTFFGCQKLSSIQFEAKSQLKFVRNQAFAYSKIRDFIFPSSVEMIENDTFFNCDELLSIEFLSNCFSNFGGLFENCKKIFLVSFPNNSLVSIGKYKPSGISKNLLLLTKPGAKLDQII